MDHHSTHITWQFGMTLETFQRATIQHTTIPQVIGPTSFSTNTTAHYTPIRAIQHIIFIINCIFIAPNTDHIFLWCLT